MQKLEKRQFTYVAGKLDSGFYTWLRKIMINCFLNHRRSKSFGWRKELADNTVIENYAFENDGPMAASLETTLDNRLVVEKVMFVLMKYLRPLESISWTEPVASVRG